MLFIHFSWKDLCALNASRPKPRSRAFICGLSTGKTLTQTVSQTPPNWFKTIRISHVGDVGNFFSSIPVTSPKDTRSPSKTNRSPFYANHPVLDKSKLAIYPCDEGLYLWLTAIVKLPINFFFLKSLFSSTHTHVDHTQINCGLQALGAWISPNWTWIWTLRRDFRHALDVRKWSCWERTYPCSRVAEHRKLSFVFHSRNECWWGQRPSVFPFFTIPMFLNYKIWANQ